MKKRNLAIIIILLAILTIILLGVLTIIGIISKVAWASFMLSLLGKDVNVEDVGNETEYIEFHGLGVPNGAWQVNENSEYELIIENKSAVIGIKVIPKELEDPSAYLEDKSLELSQDLNLSGASTYIEEYEMCLNPAYSVAASSGGMNYLIIFWYEDNKIYTINALYGERADADEVILSIACGQNKAN